MVQYIADQKPEAGLVPPPTSFERYKLQEWLNFITSELHKSFSPLFSPATPEDYKTIAKENLARRFDWLDQHLAGTQYLHAGKFSVADVYAFVIIGWAKPTPVNTNNLRNRRNDEVLVALAGPASNLVMALLGAFVVRLVVGVEASLPELVALGLVNFVVFNVMLAIFNLIPIPPLDGSTLLFRFLPPQQVWQLRPILAQYGIFILLAFVLLAGRVLSGFIYGIAFALMGVG